MDRGNDRAKVTQPRSEHGAGSSRGVSLCACVGVWALRRCCGCRRLPRRGRAGQNRPFPTTPSVIMEHKALLEVRARSSSRGGYSAGTACCIGGLLPRRPTAMQVVALSVPPASPQVRQAMLLEPPSPMTAVQSAMPTIASGQYDAPADLPPLFAAKSIDEWMKPESLAHNGLLVNRAFDGKWEKYANDLDAAKPRFGDQGELSAVVATGGSLRVTLNKLRSVVTKLLAVADLPPPLAQQILEDALVMGRALAAACPTAREYSVKMEVFGENICARWHQDHFVARMICTYLGHSGTVYTRDANVDFWELVNCGSNACVIRNNELVESVDVGDLLLIKGTQFAGAYGGAQGLVHKSPEKFYWPDGRIRNRLVFKIDVGTFGPEAEATARATAAARSAHARAQR